MRRAILMCAGEYEPIPIPVGNNDKSLRSAEAFDSSVPEDVLVVAVDGGLPRLLAQEIMPNLVLGDFDSLDSKFQPVLDQFGASHPDRLLRLPCEKDDTDTVYAARMCLQRGCTELLFYGALGGRLDHTFANIQTLAWLKKQGADGYLIGKTTMAAILGEETVFLPEDYEGTFSLFALDGQVTGVTLKGMKYSLDDETMTNSFPIGVSNEVNRETLRETGCGRASVTIGSGMALMVLEKSESEVIRRARRELEEKSLTEKDAVKDMQKADLYAEGMPDPSLFRRVPI